MVAQDFGEMEKAYRTGNPNWRNIAYEKGHDLKFRIQQALVDSAEKFEIEKYVEDPTTKKSPELLSYYQWLKQGNFDAPPQMQVDEFGQVNAFDPATGTIGFRPGKNYDLPTLARKSVFDPSREGYQTNPNLRTMLPTGESVYREEAVYNPQMIEGAISSLAGTPRS